MAETPKYFDIEDTETGKKYRIETTDPAATYDEAVEYFSTLPEDQWTQYEYRPKTATQPKTAPVRTASVAMENVPEFEYEGAIQRNVGTGVESVLTKETRNIQEIDDALATAWRSGERDPAKLAAIQNSVKEQFIGQYPELATYGSNINARTVAQAMRYEADQRARGNDLKGYVFAPSKVTTGLKDPERPTTMGGQFVESAQRSAANMYNSGVGAVALGADVVGADETADALLQEYINNNAKIAYEYGAPMQTDDIEDAGSFGMYLADTFGELGPQLTSSLGLGWAGKQAAEYGAKKGIQEFIEDRVNSGVAREVAEQQAAAFIAKRGTIGAVAAASGSSIVQETGTTFGDTYMQTGEKAPWTSLGAGALSGSLDALLPLAVLKKLGGGPVVDQFKKAFIARAGKEGLKGFALEGGTEALQEFITSLPKSYVTGETPFTEEVGKQMFEAFWKGAIGGTGVNVAAETVNSVRTVTPTTPRYTGEPIVVPTGRKNTKVYRAQLGEAQDRVIEQVNSLTEGWTNAPKIEVHESFKKLNGVADDAIGVYTTETLEDGTTIPVMKINTEAVLERAKQRDVKPEAIVEAVTFHEGLGHHGLTSLFREDLDAFLDDIYNNGSEQFRDTVDEWLRKNPGQYTKYEPHSRRILATEEVMAKWSEGGPLARTFYDNVANTIKNFAREMGMKFNIAKLENIKYTEREVKAFLAVAHERTMKGEQVGATPSVPRNMNDERTPDTYSAGFKRPKADERSKAEARKQFWKNKENPDWNPSDPNGLPTEPKYMAGDSPIDPDQLTADDFLDSDDPMQLLARAADAVPSETISPDDLEMELTARKVQPSTVLRLKGIKAGDLTKRAIRHDIVSQKIGDKAMKLHAQLKEGYDQATHEEGLRSVVALIEMQKRVWEERAEYARALGAGNRLKFTKKKVKALIKEYNLESLSDPETFMKFMSRLEEDLTGGRNNSPDFTGGLIRGTVQGLKNKNTRANTIYSWINVPRAVMSSMDLSAPLRQGIVFIGNKQFWQNWLKMFSMLGPSGEANYAYLMSKIGRHPNYGLMQEARLSFSQLDGPMSSREEDFQTELARQLPGGKLIKWSEQAYAGFLNQLRADMFNKYVEQYLKLPEYSEKVAALPDDINLDPAKRTEALVEILGEDLVKALGRLINAGTGRAELRGELFGQEVDARRYATFLNATLFSSRLMWSRLSMLNPVFYKNLPGPVRVSAFKSMATFGTIAALTVGAIALMGGDEVEVEVDPRSSQFGKIRVGDTRFDLGGGFLQYLTLGIRTSTWLYNNVVGGGERVLETYITDADVPDFRVANVKTSSGKYVTYGKEEDNREETWGGAVGDFFRSKLSPQASFAVDMALEKDFVGRPVTTEGALASRLVPMTISSMYQAYSQDSAVPFPVVGAANLFGIGTSVYTSKDLDKEQELEAPTEFKEKDWANQEDDLIRVEDGQVTLKRPVREQGKKRLDFWFDFFVNENTVVWGKPWEELDDDTKRAIIEQSKKDARNQAEKDLKAALDNSSSVEEFNSIFEE